MFSRHKEIAIRTAMGASSVRIIRQILAESVLLALLGGVLGLTSANFGIRLIMAFLGVKLPASFEVGIDLRVLVFTVPVLILTGELAGVLPALTLSEANVA